MAKKSNRRPTKGRAPRTRQTPARTNGSSPIAPDTGAVATAPPAVSSAPAAVATAAAAPAPGRRAAARAPRAPVTVINYDYLRRDIRMLLILAPSMIILVIIAFLVFH